MTYPPHHQPQGPWQPPPPPPKKGSNTVTILAVVLVVFVVAIGSALAIILSSGDPEPAASSAASSSAEWSYDKPSYLDDEPSTTPPPPATTEPPAPPTTPPPDTTTPAAFGEVWEWEDGMQATVVSAEQFTPSEYAAGAAPGEVGVKVTVTFTNASSAAVDLSTARVDLRAGEAGNTAEAVFDEGIHFEELGTVAPGQSATGVYGFAVAPEDVGVLSLTVTPSFIEYQDALFVGASA